MQRIGVIGIQFDGAFELGFRTRPVPVVDELDLTKRRMRLT